LKSKEPVSDNELKLKSGTLKKGKKKTPVFNRGLCKKIKKEKFLRVEALV
jgi:hypothetical protein